MNWVQLEQDLIRDEGVRLQRYICPAGHYTIGVGHKLRPHEQHMLNISLTEAGRLLRLDINDAITDLEAVFGPHCLDQWSERRQRYLVNMAFNLGRARFSGFQKMIAAIKVGDWQGARDECLNSKYARKDVPARAERIAKALREG
jgi:lysozyme